MQMDVIGWISSPYSEKFGVPRQSNEVPSAQGYIHFHEKYRVAEAFRGIEGFSHLWIIFQFHQAVREDWKPTVRPPRLGGNQRVGVFATRSPFRPNNMGLSVYENLGKVEHEKHGLSLKIGGIDVIDETPVFDLKPYIPHADSIIHATNGFSPPELPVLKVQWLCKCPEALQTIIEETLKLDPRPGYKIDDSIHGTMVGGVNVKWRVISEETVEVLKVE